jgi:hypothetical protein
MTRKPFLQLRKSFWLPAQTILAAAQTIFASTRKSFCLDAQVIFFGTVARPQNGLRRRGRRKPNHRFDARPPRPFECRSQIL